MSLGDSCSCFKHVGLDSREASGPLPIGQVSPSGTSLIFCDRLGEIVVLLGGEGGGGVLWHLTFIHLTDSQEISLMGRGKAHLVLATLPIPEGFCSLICQRL